MQLIQTESSYGIPRINFDAEMGLLEIEGRSIPEHPKALYLPLIDWASEYAKNPQENTEVVFKVDYMNSSSYKFILTLLEQLEPIQAASKNIVIKWHYEIDDDEMQEIGEEIRNIIKIPVEIIGVDEFE